MSYFPVIIVLIVLLIVGAIFINAFQQHKEKAEAEKRNELAKQKLIIDETEDLIVATSQFPISKRIMSIMHQRVLNSLKLMNELNPKAKDIAQRISDAAEQVKTIDVDTPPPSADSFQLPENEKQIIVYIQGVKKLRQFLRIENSKGKVETAVFQREDKLLELLQLRINIETLTKRADAAMSTNMLGSARQYLEKAIAAMSSSSQQDEFITKRRAELEHKLKAIQDNLRNSNSQDVKKRQEEEKDELDELFAPKKKW
jgi:flagellar basal body-associated protein FliL